MNTNDTRSDDDGAQDREVRLSPREQELLFSVIELSHAVASETDFIAHVYPKLVALVPHQYCCAGIGNITERYAHKLLNINIPEGYMRRIVTPDGYLLSPVAREWAAERRPQFVVYDALAGSFEENDPLTRKWAAAARQFGFKNAAGHGMADIHTALTSYFGFLNIEGEWDTRKARLLELVTPHLHLALMRLLSPPCHAYPFHEHLSAREREVLRWMCLGKASDEIGLILDISEWTVKEHIKATFRKLQVTTRTHAIATALRVGLIKL
jgi:transcriptional regulator EpsA